MPINVTMPALSPTMEEGNLAQWLVNEGDEVNIGDVIAEIETDKATMEVEAVDEGTLAKIVVPGGTEGVKVNAVIGVLAAEGESVDDAAKAANAGDDGSQAGPAQGGDAKAGPAAADAKADAAVETSQSQAADPDTRGSSRPSGGTAAQTGGESAEPAEGKGERIFASPLARRLAKDAGLNLSAIKGSGPHGRIVKADIEKAEKEGIGKAEAKGQAAPARSETQAAPAEAASAPKGPSDEQVKKLFAEGSFEEVPHDGMRKTIAKRLVEAKTTIPHFYLTVDCELDALLALRKQLNDSAPMGEGDKPRYKLSVNDMIIKAMAIALKQVPDANVTWTEGAMLKHSHADVGVAVSIEGGLITPIVKRADEKTLSAISNEMKDLAKRARERKLKPEEYQGGTTAVSNLGMYGIKDFAAVINPPHSTILAVGAGEQRPVVRDGAVTTATMMSVTLSTDHRSVDGALGAELVAAFKQLVENPMSMLV